jgi:hypothetical protein
MRELLQPGATSPQQQPLRLRWMAAICVLLIAIMSTVQVCHMHELVPQPLGSHQSLPDSGPDHCPLCVAMHSAMPTTLQSAPEPVILMHTLDSVAADSERIFKWRFQLASRPPPADFLRS